MPSARAIKQRIKSAKNISKITKAMEMVSASKMRRSQEQANASRPYALALQEMLKKISMYTDSSMHPLLEERPLQQSLLIIVSTDRGLVGGLNANLNRSIIQWQERQSDFSCVSIGKKAKLFVQKMGWKLFADFSSMPDRIEYINTLPISSLIMNAFLNNEFQSVHMVHMESLNALSQKPHFNHLLPITTQEIENPAELIEVEKEYIFEPSAKEVLNWLLPYYIENDVYFALLEAKASEHSARMIAMKNASDNAKEVVKVLGLEYNRSRQANITQELQEITTAQMTL